MQHKDLKHMAYSHAFIHLIFFELVNCKAKGLCIANHKLLAFLFIRC